MPRPDPAFLDTARYPFSCNLAPRFGDLDVNMHVNNVAMAGLLEDGRVRFLQALQFRNSHEGVTAMVASVAIEYLGEADYAGDIALACAIEAIGRNSLTLVQVGTQHGSPVIFARTVIVGVGPDGPSPLASQFAAAAEQWTLRS